MSTAPVTARLATSNTLAVLIGLFSVLMLGSLGCRSARDNQIDLLERELRTQEDYIYELEDYVLEYSEKLRQVRSSQSHQIVTQARPLEPVLAPAKQNDEQPVEEPLNKLSEPKESAPMPEPAPEPSEPEEVLPEDLEIPELDISAPEPVGQLEQLRDDSQLEAEFARDPEYASDSDSSFNSNNDSDNDNNNEILFVEDEAVELASLTDEYSPAETRDGEDDSEAEFLDQLFEKETPEPDYYSAERLVIVDVFRGDQSDEPPTSLLTVIEARDENDEPVDLEGSISLMIMTADPVAPQRLKRWDFSPDETASAWQSSQLGDGLHLELPLEDLEESAEPLELWVRLVKADGRKLLAQLPLYWDQLISVEEAMEAQPLSLPEDDLLAEPSARPLQQQDRAEFPLAAQEHQSARSEIRSENEPRKPATHWRASLPRTRSNAATYSSTVRTAKGWTSQPIGGREPFARAATASQSAATARQSAVAPPSKKPAWTAGRHARKNSAQQNRPQWAPPK